MNTKIKSKDWKEFVFKKAERLISQATTPLSVKEAAWKAVKYATACGQSDPVSFALRPIAYHKHFRRMAGWSLVVFVLTAAAWGPWPSMASDTGGALSVVLPEGEVKLTTLEAVAWPIAGREISQGFWLLHAGIDIRTPQGTPVHPIMAGRVTEIETGRYGYGEKAVVSHEKGYQSLYAHMSRIFVKVGDKVTTESVVGLSGNTGRSTGPHLHLEIHFNGKTINPLSVLENK